MYITWQEPRQANGVIMGYRVYYVHNNLTDVRTVRATGQHMGYTLDALGMAKT